MKGLLHEFALHMRAERTPLEIMEYHQLVKFVDWVQATRPEYDAAPEMYEALASVEWISTSGEWWVCPWCMEAKHEGHRPDCQRQDALARAKGEQP